MKDFIKRLFTPAKKSNWIDVGMYDRGGHYKLVQMRYRIDNNRKEFRTVSLGFVSDYVRREDLFTNIQAFNNGKMELK